MPPIPGCDDVERTWNEGKQIYSISGLVTGSSAKPAARPLPEMYTASIFITFCASNDTPPQKQIGSGSRKLRHGLVAVWIMMVTSPVGGQFAAGYVRMYSLSPESLCRWMHVTLREGWPPIPYGFLRWILGSFLHQTALFHRYSSSPIHHQHCRDTHSKVIL